MPADAHTALLHVAPGGVTAWPLREGRADAGAAERHASVEAALTAWRGATLHIALAGRLLHTDVRGAPGDDSEPPAPPEPDPARALAAARARWVRRLGAEAAAWPLAQWRAPDPGDAQAPREVQVAWHGEVEPGVAPAAQIERWQAAARAAGVRLGSIRPAWTWWAEPDALPESTAGQAHVQVWAETDAALLHLTCIEFDALGLAAVRQRRWPLRPGEGVEAALARFGHEAGFAIDRMGTLPSSPPAGRPSGSGRPAIPQPDFLRPQGPAARWPRMARGLVALAGVAAIAALVDGALAWHAWQAAGTELAQWRQLEQRRAVPRAAPVPTPARGARDSEARRAAWAVQRELEHPWAAMGTAWQAAPSLDPGLRWLALEHGGPAREAGAVATWLASAQVRRPEDALALADALAAAAPWQSVRVQRLEPVAAGTAWRVEMRALWSLSEPPTRPPVPARAGGPR